MPPQLGNFWKYNSSSLSLGRPIWHKTSSNRNKETPIESDHKSNRNICNSFPPIKQITLHIDRNVCIAGHIPARRSITVAKPNKVARKSGMFPSHYERFLAKGKSALRSKKGPYSGKLIVARHISAEKNKIDSAFFIRIVDISCYNEASQINLSNLPCMAYCHRTFLPLRGSSVTNSDRRRYRRAVLTDGWVDEVPQPPKRAHLHGIWYLSKQPLTKRRHRRAKRVVV